MRKGKLVIVALVVLGGGYLAAQAYSSVLFERELSRTLEGLQQRNDLQLSREEVSRGWLVSQGEIHLLPANGEAWRLELPYTARHGVLDTRVEGELMLRRGEDGERVFGGPLDAPSPRWDARYRTLHQTFEATLNMAPFTQWVDESLLTFGGADLLLQGQRGDLTLSGQVDPWQWESDDARLEIGPLVLESQYRYNRAPDYYLQRDDLHFANITYRRGEGPAIEVEALGYRGEMQLDDEELDLSARVSLGEARLGGRPALAGQLDLALSQINANAARALADHLRYEVDLLQDNGIEHSGEALLARLEPYLLGMLADSPRLALESLRLESPLLGMHIAIDGELTFAGNNLSSLSPGNLDDPEEQERWRSRLNGHFTWHDLPLLVALQLGLPLDTEELSIDIIDGQVWLNEQTMPPLF